MIDQGSNHIIRKCSLIANSASLQEEYSIIAGNPTVSYFESIESPSISMIVTFIDADQVISRKGITGGESIDLTIGVVGFDDEFKIESKKHNLVLNSVKDVTTAKNRQLATLEFVSTESIINESSRLNKKFTGNVSSIVDDILTREKKGILTKKKLEKDEAVNSYSFVGNLKRPFDTIQWLCPKAQSSKKDFGFLFFENYEGYHFKSIKSLLEQDPSATYSSIEVPNNATPLKIVENRLNSSNDVGMNCRMGMYANKTIYIDLENETYEEVDFDVSELKLKKTPKLSDDFTKPSRLMFRILDHGALQKGSKKEEVEKRNELAIYQNKSYARNNLLFSQSLSVSMELNISLRVGNLIQIQFPFKKDPDLTKTQLGKEDDNDISGRYIVSQLRHIFSNGEAETQLTLIRDVFTATKQDA